jgi:hypothetical protein
VRRLAILLTFGAMCLLLGASTNADGSLAAKCSKWWENHAAVGERVFDCTSGRAVVKSKGGVSHVMLRSRCFVGSRGARLYFGMNNQFGPVSKAPTNLQLMMDRLPGRPDRAQIFDGSVALSRADVNVALIGTARLTDGFRRGTFSVAVHVGNGVPGTRAFSGHWNCVG